MEQILKWFIIICFILIFGFAVGSLVYSEAYADEDKYLQESNIDKRKEVIHDADGETEGYLQKSPIDPRKTIQYDKDGEVEGYWQKSNIDPRKTVFTEKE